MSPERSGPLDSDLSSLDVAGTLKLCATLAEYAEAGGLSQELLLRVGRFAVDKFSTNLEILLAVGRLYHLGGQPALARDALLRAVALAPDEVRATRLLGQVASVAAPEKPEEPIVAIVERDALVDLSARARARGVLLPRGVALRLVVDALAGLHAAHQRKNELDRRSDLFTMGVLLWEVLTSRTPFARDTEAVSPSHVLMAQMSSIRLHVPDVPPTIDEVCLRALQPNPRRRFPTAAAMAAALKEAAKIADLAIASPDEVARCVETLLGPNLVAHVDSTPSPQAPPVVEAPPPAPPPVLPAPEPPPAAAPPVDALPPAAAPPVDALPPAAPPVEALPPAAPPMDTLPVDAPQVDAPQRSRRTLVAVALIVAVGATSPIWMGKVTRTLHPERPPGAQSATPRGRL